MELWNRFSARSLTRFGITGRWVTSFAAGWKALGVRLVPNGGRSRMAHGVAG